MPFAGLDFCVVCFFSATTRRLRDELDGRISDFAAKIDQAKAHLDALRESIDRWGEDSPHRLSDEFDSEGVGRYVFSHFLETVKPMPTEWPLVIVIPNWSHWKFPIRRGINSQFAGGAVLYCGEHTVRLDERIWAVPLSGLWRGAV